jgi:hypothetical protein
LGYHGEFWKHTQTNKWQHVYGDGLLVGVFGVTGIEFGGNGAVRLNKWPEILTAEL